MNAHKAHTHTHAHVHTSAMYVGKKWLIKKKLTQTHLYIHRTLCEAMHGIKPAAMNVCEYMMFVACFFFLK